MVVDKKNPEEEYWGTTSGWMVTREFKTVVPSADTILNNKNYHLLSTYFAHVLSPLILMKTLLK